MLCSTFPNDLPDPDALLAESELMGKEIEKIEWGQESTRRGKLPCWKIAFLYPCLANAYQLALTIPVSVASNERSFSKLRLVKKLPQINHESRSSRRVDDINSC